MVSVRRFTKSGDKSVRHTALAPYVNGSDPHVRLPEVFADDCPPDVLGDPHLNTAWSGSNAGDATSSGGVAARVAESDAGRPDGACRPGTK